MSDFVVIEGVPPYDGRYEFDVNFTVREWGWIKRYSGYLPLTLWDGWRQHDPELMSVFALVGLVRAGKADKEDAATVWERFADAPGVVSVRLELEARADDADPPPESSNENESSSGDGSNGSSETLVRLPPATGTPGSDTSESRQETAWAN